jgi:hypothetical protein
MAILNETQGDERVPTGERFYEKALHKGARRLPATATGRRGSL